MVIYIYAQGPPFEETVNQYMAARLPIDSREIVPMPNGIGRTARNLTGKARVSDVS